MRPRKAPSGAFGVVWGRERPRPGRPGHHRGSRREVQPAQRRAREGARRPEGLPLADPGDGRAHGRGVQVRLRRGLGLGLAGRRPRRVRGAPDHAGAEGPPARHLLDRDRLRALEDRLDAGHEGARRLDQRGRGGDPDQPRLGPVGVAARAPALRDQGVEAAHRAALDADRVGAPRRQGLLAGRDASDPEARATARSRRWCCSTSTRAISSPRRAGRRSSRSSPTAARSSSSPPRTGSAAPSTTSG